MWIGSYLEANAQAFEVVQPGEGALDDPPDLAQTGTVRDATPGGLRHDATLMQQGAVLVVVVASVGEHATWSMPRPASSSTHVWDRLDQRQQPGAIVPVTAAQRHRSGVPCRSTNT